MAANHFNRRARQQRSEIELMLQCFGVTTRSITGTYYSLLKVLPPTANPLCATQLGTKSLKTRPLKARGAVFVGDGAPAYRHGDSSAGV